MGFCRAAGTFYIRGEKSFAYLLQVGMKPSVHSWQIDASNVQIFFVNVKG